MGDRFYVVVIIVSYEEKLEIDIIVTYTYLSCVLEYIRNATERLIMG